MELPPVDADAAGAAADADADADADAADRFFRLPVCWSMIMIISGCTGILTASNKTSNLGNLKHNGLISRG